jgi:hypothetical protein
MNTNKLVVMVSDEVMVELQRRKDEFGSPLSVTARILIEQALGLRQVPVPKRTA